MSDTQKNAQGNTDHGRRFSTVKRVPLWLAAVVVAVFPFPWW